MFEITEAERSRIKIKIGLSGPSGSGKTYSAILLALGMTGGDATKIGVIDTENRSALLYSHFGKFKHLDLTPPYTPERCTEAFLAMVNKGVEVIIFDSLSHEWSGTGGCSELVEKMSNGNEKLRWLNWGKVKLRHKQFISELLQANVHVIGCFRSKSDYLKSEENGREKMKKVGIKPDTTEGTDFDFSIFLDIDQNNYASQAKDRSGGIFREPRVLSMKDGEAIINFCMIGKGDERVNKIDYMAIDRQLSENPNGDVKKIDPSEMLPPKEGDNYYTNILLEPNNSNANSYNYPPAKKAISDVAIESAVKRMAAGEIDLYDKIISTFNLTSNQLVKLNVAKKHSIK